MIEVMVAALIATLVIGSVTTSIAQLGRAKATCRSRLDAYMRADMALNSIRRNVASVLRAEDLFYTRLLLLDDSVKSPAGDMDRDELLVYSTRLRALRNIEFRGEGTEYETQFRVAEDDMGPMLWQRRDALPDEYPLGGGLASPVAEGVVSLRFEAYDGFDWYDEWDSDVDGLPLAIRVTVMASGHRTPHDVYESPLASLRTVVSIDRVPPPIDPTIFQPPEPEILEDDTLDPSLVDGLEFPEGVDPLTGETAVPTRQFDGDIMEVPGIGAGTGVGGAAGGGSLEGGGAGGGAGGGPTSRGGGSIDASPPSGRRPRRSTSSGGGGGT